MTRPTILLGAVALLLLFVPANPASAQHVITNPGKCAQFYPNANCQNKGPGNPYTDPRRFSQGYVAPDGTQAVVVKKRTRTSATRM